MPVWTFCQENGGEDRAQNGVFKLGCKRELELEKASGVYYNENRTARGTEKFCEGVTGCRHGASFGLFDFGVYAGRIRLCCTDRSKARQSGWIHESVMLSKEGEKG